jgi:hypothetical protein
VKKLLVIAALLAFFASIGLAQEKQYDVPSVFSFSYGDGWSKGPRKGGSAAELPWLVSTSDPTASFHAVLARADFSYDDWIKRMIKAATPERALASKGDFESTSGEKGYKLVWKVKAANGDQFTNVQYLFRGKGDSQILLSGMVDVANAEKIAPEFDTFAKSFKITKAK